MIPREDGGTLLPMPVPAVPQPEGDPATLHNYAKTYLQMAWWSETLRNDLITTGRWILVSMDFDGVREYAERKLLNLISEIGLHHRGYTQASHACEQYAKRLAALKTGARELNRQAGEYNQALTVLLSRCTGEITPALHAEINAMRTRRRNLTDAIAAGEALEQQAADSAAKNFLAAKIMNSNDLNLLRRAADPNLPADQRQNLLAQALGTVLVSGLTKEQADTQFRQLMARNGMKSVFDSVLADFNSGLGRGAAGAGARAGLRLAGGALGTVFGVVLDLALFPDTLADGDLDDMLSGARPFSDLLQKTRLFDDDGNEIELPHVDEEPEPSADGAAKPPYNCDDPTPGDDWGGPGLWRDVNRGTYEALWKRYQEQVTGVKVGHEYSHGGVDFDGFQKAADGTDVFVEAKSRFYSGAFKAATFDKAGNLVVPADSFAEEKLDALLDQLNRQTGAISDTPGARLRYVMAEADALEKLKWYAQKHMDAAAFARIDWEHQDNDFDFDGC